VANLSRIILKENDMGFRQRFAQIGLGSRSEMYSKAIVVDYKDKCELIALSDNNRGRLNDRMDWARANGADVPGYDAASYDRMLAETRPDCMVVTTVDCYHDDYICRAMEAGCDVITEKPMTIDEHKCRRILDTQKRTGKKCTVTFNYRYSPPRTQVKDLLMSRVIGDVLSVDFHWMLDTYHGVDYFRRWHRWKKNSGGLMVHKATHHFDLVNWWLGTLPETVFAMGRRKFYMPATADRLGLKNRGERCHGCPEANKCALVLDMQSIEGLRKMYLENEHYDGYYRDRCVFSADMDIEDSVVASVSYKNGAHLSYSLNAFMPWEGYAVTFNGTKGRLEHKCEEQVYVSGDGSVPGALKKEGTWIKIYPLFQPAYEVPIWEAEGGHGGADPIMLQHIFDPPVEKDKYLRAADQRAGAYSILCGIAANKSMASGGAIRIEDLVKDIGMPDYPPMPSVDEPLTIVNPTNVNWLFS